MWTRVFDAEEADAVDFPCPFLLLVAPVRRQPTRNDDRHLQALPSCSPPLGAIGHLRFSALAAGGSAGTLFERRRLL